jgi:putative photosynthetic complex assembly protein
MDPSTPPKAPFPRSILLGAAGLVVSVIVLAGVGRVTGMAGSQIEPAAPVQSVELRFEDQPDGAVAIYEVPQGRTVALLAPGTSGFVRGVLRGMARERRQYSVGTEPPFRLTRWENGGLSLEDPQTGRRIELGAFGQTNLDAFARLLPTASKSS